VVSAVGIILAWLGHGRFQALEARIDRLEDRFDKRMDGFDKRLDGFQVSLDRMRSDLTAVALAMGAQPRAGRSGGSL
jgi:hypothetical protein